MQTVGLNERSRKMQVELRFGRDGGRNLEETGPSKESRSKVHIPTCHDVTEHASMQDESTMGWSSGQIGRIYLLCQRICSQVSRLGCIRDQDWAYHFRDGVKDDMHDGDASVVTRTR